MKEKKPVPEPRQLYIRPAVPEEFAEQMKGMAPDNRARLEALIGAWRAQPVAVLVVREPGAAPVQVVRGVMVQDNRVDAIVFGPTATEADFLRGVATLIKDRQLIPTVAEPRRVPIHAGTVVSRTAEPDQPLRLLSSAQPRPQLQVPGIGRVEIVSAQ